MSGLRISSEHGYCSARERGSVVEDEDHRGESCGMRVEPAPSPDQALAHAKTPVLHHPPPILPRAPTDSLFSAVYTASNSNPFSSFFLVSANPALWTLLRMTSLSPMSCSRFSAAAESANAGHEGTDAPNVSASSCVTATPSSFAVAR